jgi:type IV secretory pathway TraG/TraD family ATPase VirD4
MSVFSLGVGIVVVLILIITAIADKYALFDFQGDVAMADEQTPKQHRISGDKTLLGTVRSGIKPVYIENNAKHVFVCGTTGSGKTVALANFIKSGIEHNYPLLIVDGKGDINENSIYDIVKKLAGQQKKIYTIDLNNPQTSDKYNPFKNTTPTVIKDMLINLTEWSEEHYKLNTERYLQRLIDLLAKAQIPTSLKNIIAYIESKKFIGLSSEVAKKGGITKDEHAANVALADNSKAIIDGAAARFTSLYESDVGKIFDDNGVDIYTALQENAIILFILNPLLYPEISPLFGNLVIIDSKKAVSNLFNSNTERIFFIFDEINVYASTSLLDLVNKSRSANVTCTLATQSLSDLDARAGEHFKEQIIENCNNYIVLRQNSAVNAEKWAQIIGTRNVMDLTYQVNPEGSTGLGSARRTREYICHPDDIKSFKTGQGLYLSKDSGYYTKLKIHKSF